MNYHNLLYRRLFLLIWPESKKFAFTIFDDTDNSYIDNISPIYDLLNKNEIYTTKSVWVKPSKDEFEGYCLEDAVYLKYIKELEKQGFEIALHNVGSGYFSRAEITEGVDFFRELMGGNPKIQVNHVSNPDNLYWGSKRFVKPFSFLYRLLSRRGPDKSSGEETDSIHFWGDIVKERIKYIRNFTFNGINTLKYDPHMPYIDPYKKDYSNYWFSSSDGHTVEEFNELLTKENIDKLEKEGGLCIVYTHFAEGFVDENGNLNPEFKNKIEYLSSKSGCIW